MPAPSPIHQRASAPTGKASLALVARRISTRPTDSEQERPVLQGADSVTNTALDRNERAGHDFPLVVSGREGESATDRLHGDRSGGDMLMQLCPGAHRDQDHSQTWRLEQCFRSPATGHVWRE